MSWYGLISFCAVYIAAVATPGPGVAAVIARSVARGYTGAAAFIAGFVAGDLLWFSAAALGLSALAHSVPGVFAALKYAGAAYLLFIAARLWFSPGTSPLEWDGAGLEQKRWHAFAGSLMLTLSNPKPMIFFLALLPTVVPLERLGAKGFVEIAFAIAVILPGVLGVYVLAASRARSWFRSPRANQMLNRASGTLMAAAAVAVATR
jgi:threonine/homoserine/homoserine lactone efflux protein